MLLSFQLFAVGQDSEKDYSEAFTLVGVWLEAQKDYENLPGISAAAVEKDKILWSAGFGMANPETGVETEASTICSICSISKLFTAVAIMKLWEEDKLRLDDKVSTLLPWFDLEQQFDDSTPITVRSLLTHSSGLPREANFPYWSSPNFDFPTTEEMISELKNQKTLYPSSTYFQYSNLGLSLLGEIVTEVSDQSFESYIQEKILTPLALKDTRAELPEELYGKQLAIGYSSLTRTGKREKVNFFQARGIKAAAGFSSNVLDLGKFAIWQLRLLEEDARYEILRPSTLRYMQNVHWTNPDWKTTWGLGFAVDKDSDGSKWVSHGGSCPGYRSTFQLNPKSKRGYAVMINASGANPEKYAKGIHSILNKVQEKDEDSEGEEVSEVDLKEYEGFYDQQPWWGEYYFTAFNGKLAGISLPTDSPGENLTFYKHISGDTFRRLRDDDELGEEVVFERDQEGRIYRFIQHDQYFAKLNRQLR
jgi:CubicO group peptidase (beta-lactamase class C family)